MFMKCYYMFGIFLYLQQLTPFTELGTGCMKDKRLFLWIMPQFSPLYFQIIT